MRLEKKVQLKIDGKRLKFAIILPYFNENLGLELYENAKKELLKNNVQEKNITLTRVAGSLELPLACQKIIQKQKPDAVIALGVIIRGETSHYDLVTENTYRGIMKVQLKTGTPISFGVLGCENLAQAKKRISTTGLNKGADAAIAALIQTTI